MTDATHSSQVIPRNGVVRLRLPFAGPIIQRMMAIYVVLMFFVSANVLDTIGYDYSSIDGSPIMKIHVATYFLVALFGLFIVSYPQKSDLFRYYLATKLGTIYFFLACTFALINIVLEGRNGFGMYFDTDLNLFLCCMLLPFVSPANMTRLERFVHWFFALNAVYAIFDLATGIKFFPLIAYSPDGITTIESRAAGFLSHPLHAATITSVYVVSLLTGAGRELRPNLRNPMIVLQMGALLAFGGRTAFILMLLILSLTVLWRSFRFLAGVRIAHRDIVVAVASLPIGIAALSLMAAMGAFDQLLERFVEDGGSARSRVLMVPLIRSFNWGDLLWGASTDYVRSQIYSFGLEWGVENPFLQIGVFQGVVIALLIMVGFLLLLYDVYNRLSPRVIFPMMIFVALCSTFGSFSQRFTAFAIFIVVISALFRRDDAPTEHVY
ncbi:VpsF family polysaccharide biosynthesis protein [Bradyrhizobium sp. SYSU BS000235]|uniref:VpsF family polysaccharide biosynthesis protein n=1 Tax=Bradyrhizobium sp. SYSU BS000235 TaxID=3411332 RepID=UPI003C778F88